MRSVFLILLAVALMPANAEAGQGAAEKSTAKQISGHLQQSGQLRNYRIGVTYQDGVATLAGTVTSAEQRIVAIRLAKEVKGVKRVECKLDCTEQAEGLPAKDGTLELTNDFVNTNAGAKPASSQGEQSGVVQAYSERGLIEAAPQQRQLQQQRPTMLSQNNQPRMNRPQATRRNNMPRPTPRYAADPAVRQASAQGVYQAGGTCPPGYGGMGPAMGGMGGPGGMAGMGGPAPSGVVPTAYGRGPSYENPQMPGYAWPSYAAYPNYAALSYPQQYSPTAWPYIGPFYPYPQVPLAWRKVSLEWDDGWWFLDFSSHNSSH
jgi:hypothetical protein